MAFPQTAIVNQDTPVRVAGAGTLGDGEVLTDQMTAVKQQDKNLVDGDEHEYEGAHEEEGVLPPLIEISS